MGGGLVSAVGQTPLMLSPLLYVCTSLEKDKEDLETKLSDTWGEGGSVIFKDHPIVGKSGFVW